MATELLCPKKLPTCPGVTPVVVFSACAVGSLLMAWLLSREVRKTIRAVPRMVCTSGVVKELNTVLTSREAGKIRSFTVVNVDFEVAGKPYSCRTLFLFAGNRHVGDVGKKYDFPPGQTVGLYYYPEDPRLNALIIDRPDYGLAVIAVVMTVIFGIMAAVSAF